MVRVIVISLLLVGGINAQEYRSLPPPGVYPYAFHDSVKVAGGEADTSGSYDFYGGDLYAFEAQYTALDDSTNIKVYADFSYDGERWFLSVGLDTMIVSGQTDTVVSKRLNVFPDYPVFVRGRVVNDGETTDTIAVRTVLIIHRLGLLRLR